MWKSIQEINISYVLARPSDIISNRYQFFKAGILNQNQRIHRR